MKKILLKVLVVLTAFILAILVTSKFVNKDSVDLTSEMADATLPVVTTSYNGIAINRMYGYVEDMALSYMRDTITPLMSGRKMQIIVDTYGQSVLGMEYEVRTVDGSRLIENTKIENFTVDARKIVSDIVIKDLIENNKEYEFILKLQLSDGTNAKYYTRILSPEEYHIVDKLEYVSDFSNRTFNKATAQELTKYLEPNSSGDNSTFGHVDIHSSFDQVTWGELHPIKVTDPVINVKELSPLTGSFLVDYYVSVNDETDIKYYKIEEFFRIRYGRDRIYLLDYERGMDQVFVEEKTSYSDKDIILGITANGVSFSESEDGNTIAFVPGGRLYSYTISDNKIAYLFGFYDTFSDDMRLMNNDHKIKIMNIDEAGNVTFLVYGYFNRGNHEGEVGLSAYYYDAAVNTIEELAFIASNHAPDLTIREVEQLSYMSSKGMLYELIGSKLYEIDAKNRRYEVIAEDLTEGSYRISDNNRMVVWQVGADNNDAQQIVLMNLDTSKKTTVDASYNETISPIGFMGEDLIYGVARKNDITKARSGQIVTPMYKVCIINEQEGELMDYEQEDIYVYEGEVNGNLITLHRLILHDDGTYEETTNDQIMNSDDVTATKNILSSFTSDIYKKMSIISLNKPIDAQSMKHLKPKTILYEGTRQIDIDVPESDDKYIVYGRYGADSFSVSANSAVMKAYDISGIVMDKDGNYIFKKTSRSTKNQIMAIEQENVSENRSSLAVCLDTMMEYEGVIRNSEYMLGLNQSVLEILQDALPDYGILDLTGCSLDMVLYYVNLDIPVLAMLDNSEAVLIVGFNDTEVALMDPHADEIYKISMEEATDMFEDNGNCFITYIRSDN